MRSIKHIGETRLLDSLTNVRKAIKDNLEKYGEYYLIEEVIFRDESLSVADQQVQSGRLLKIHYFASVEKKPTLKKLDNKIDWYVANSSSTIQENIIENSMNSYSDEFNYINNAVKISVSVKVENTKYGVMIEALNKLLAELTIKIRSL